MKITASIIKSIAALTLAVVIFTTSSANAQTIAYTASPQTAEVDNGGYGLSGLEFTLSQNINLTSLGFTALSLGGGDTPHVALWQVNGSLSSLTLLYDTGNIIGSVVSTGQGSQTGVPSFVSVGTPIALTSGNTYLVTAPAYWVATFPSSDITYASGVFSSASLLSDGGWNGGWDPTNTTYSEASLTPASPTNTPITPNFKFTVSGVPEPSTYALMGLGLLVLVVGMRSRARVS